jgi:hypothetical protein
MICANVKELVGLHFFLTEFDCQFLWIQFLVIHFRLFFFNKLGNQFYDLRIQVWHWMWYLSWWLFRLRSIFFVSLFSTLFTCFLRFHVQVTILISYRCLESFQSLWWFNWGVMGDIAFHRWISCKWVVQILFFVYILNSDLLTSCWIWSFLVRCLLLLEWTIDHCLLSFGELRT